MFVKDTFIRPFFGDVLVVMLLFSFVKIFSKSNSIKIAIAVLLFAYMIEILQYFNFIESLGIQDNKIARVVLGATFDWLDLGAYTLGVIFSMVLDNKLNGRISSKE